MTARLNNAYQKMKAPVHEVYERVRAPKPTHFKRVIVFGLILVALGVIMLIIAALLPYPPYIALEKVADKIMYIGGGLAGASVTARK